MQIARQCPVDIVYHSIAYCRLHQAERVFRLDCIERAELVESEG